MCLCKFTVKTDSLKQYVALRQSLVAEKAKLEARLTSINQALACSSKAAPAVATVKPEKKKKRKMSAAGREAIRAAQKARWAKVKSGKKS